MSVRHATKLALASPVPREVECGTKLALVLAASCPAGCRLRGDIEAVAPDGAVLRLPHDGTANGATELCWTAPNEVGDYAWKLRFVPADVEAAMHESGWLAVRVRTLPHPTSLAVWGVATPVPVGARLAVRVGVKCAAGCRLAGARVTVCDEANVTIGEGRLGDEVWPRTRGLYVAEVPLTAPASEGLVSWKAAFAGNDSPPPHACASGAFSFRAGPRPEHRVAILVSDDSGNAVTDVDVFMGAYRAATGASGRAHLDVPKGTYEIVFQKHGYEAPAATLEVAGDKRLEVQARLVPQPDPDEEEIWM